MAANSRQAEDHPLRGCDGRGICLPVRARLIDRAIAKAMVFRCLIEVHSIVVQILDQQRPIGTLIVATSIGFGPLEMSGSAARTHDLP